MMRRAPKPTFGLQYEMTTAPLWQGARPVRRVAVPVILGAIAGLALGAAVIVVCHVPVREAVSPDFNIAETIQ